MANSSSPSSAVESKPIVVHDVIVDDDEDVDGCSICLEPFSSQDPPTVTTCKHEYHLHCIIEWSQRSKECPICWRRLSLADSSSQELLAAAESERSTRSSIRQINEVHEDHHVAPYVDDSDFEERILRHLTAATRRARAFSRRRRHPYVGSDFSGLLSSAPVADMSFRDHINNSQEELPDVDSAFPDVGSPTPHTLSTMSSFSPSVIRGESSSVNSRDSLIKPRSSDNFQRSGSSELLSFKESLRSKFSAASARCKESISKGTHGFKEKLMAHNTTVKVLSKEVQKEMSAGIAGVARMIDRLDFSSKKGGVVPSSTSNYSADKGKGVQQRTTQIPGGDTVGSTNTATHVARPLPNTILGCPEVPVPQTRE